MTCAVDCTCVVVRRDVHVRSGGVVACRCRGACVFWGGLMLLIVRPIVLSCFQWDVFLRCLSLFSCVASFRSCLWSVVALGVSHSFGRRFLFLPLLFSAYGFFSCLGLSMMFLLFVFFFSFFGFLFLRFLFWSWCFCFCLFWFGVCVSLPCFFFVCDRLTFFVPAFQWEPTGATGAGGAAKTGTCFPFSGRRSGTLR